MTVAVALIALTLGRPLPLVSLVYEQASRVHGLDPALACAVVEVESQYNPRARVAVYDERGKYLGDSWGLYQLFSVYHPQLRSDIRLHAFYGGCYLAWCIEEQGGVRRGLARYYAGYNLRLGYDYADAVMRVWERIREALDGAAVMG